MTHNGMTTLAACGPLDDNTLDDATLRVCDVGHIAIAWSDWAAVRCPICARVGTLSGVLADAHAGIIEEAEKVHADEVSDLENTESDLRQVIRDAHESMDKTWRILSNKL